MIIWRVLTEAAGTERIDEDPGRALEWVQKHLPELFLRLGDAQGRCLRDETGRELVQALFKWEVEWPKWQENFRALLWLEQQRLRPPTPKTHQDRIPEWVFRV